jgi:fumarate hydratase class I
VSAFRYQPLFELGFDDTPYRKLSSEGIGEAEILGAKALVVEPEALTLLASQAVRDISHLFRTSHLEQVRRILDDPEASDNDRFVALQMLRNANVSAGMILPSCQDTGTAIVIGHKGQYVVTRGSDEEAISRGIYETYTKTNLRYSQMAPLSMYEEKNTRTNLPAQIDLYADEGAEYHFLFITKGGGSANKSFLYQETRAI